MIKMKDVSIFLSIGFTIICTIGICGYIGYMFNHLVIGFILGTIIAISYLLKVAFKNGNN